MPPFLSDVHVVSHTHWDREWYHTVDRFRQRLVSLIDDLLDDPPRIGESFLLDGQAILLEDYLAVRPERASELSALLRDGRLEAGPWFVLADELIPTGEALVRNLLMGRDVVRRLRGEAPRVLYCPDSFGHPAVLPDIATGFGCDVVVLWRGFGGVRWPVVDVVRWHGPSGAAVLVYHLPRDGYEFGSSLPLTRDTARDRWAAIANVMSPRANAGVVMLLNGADHHARQHGVRAAIDLLAEAATPVNVRASSLQTAATAIATAATKSSVPAIQGELRDSYGYAWTLQGTMATRAAQKRRNALAERTLVRDVEPWLALAPDGGTRGRRAMLHAAWKMLLHSHPHDTLCGTSIDAVADAFDARLRSVQDQSSELRSGALQQLVAHQADEARCSPAKWQPAVLLRNPCARRRAGVVELTLRAKVADVAVGPGSATRQATRARVGAFRVANMAIQILSRLECIELTESAQAYPDADIVVEARAVGWITDIGGYVIESRPQRGPANVVAPNPVRATRNALDNGRVRVEVSDDGAVSIEDRATGRCVPDVIAFERHRDVGDLYTPAIRDTLDPPRLTRVSLVHRGPLRGEIALDFAAGARAVRRSRCRVTLRLDADASLVHVIVTGDNRDRDHRLRLVIRTGLESSRTIADAAFTTVERHALDISESDARMEHVVNSAPLHRWVARVGSNTGVTLFSDGLAEYESVADGSIAVTLVRSVGELSRADLPERPGHAGWPAPTPGAQCPGAYTARFALRIHGGDSPELRAEIECGADDVLVPMTGETLRSNLREPLAAGGLELHGEGLVFSAAVPAQRDGWIALRCVNQRDTAVRGAWHIRRPTTEAVRARLDETSLDTLPIRDGVIHFAAAPREIVTILVR